MERGWNEVEDQAGFQTMRSPNENKIIELTLGKNQVKEARHKAEWHLIYGREK